MWDDLLSAPTLLMHTPPKEVVLQCRLVVTSPLSPCRLYFVVIVPSGFQSPSASFPLSRLPCNHGCYPWGFCVAVSYLLGYSPAASATSKPPVAFSPFRVMPRTSWRQRCDLGAKRQCLAKITQQHRIIATFYLRQPNSNLRLPCFRTRRLLPPPTL